MTNKEKNRPKNWRKMSHRVRNSSFKALLTLKNIKYISAKKHVLTPSVWWYLMFFWWRYTLILRVPWIPSNKRYFILRTFLNELLLIIVMIKNFHKSRQEAVELFQQIQVSTNILKCALTYNTWFRNLFYHLLIVISYQNTSYLLIIAVSFTFLQEAVDEPFQLNQKNFCFNFFGKDSPKLRLPVNWTVAQEKNCKNHCPPSPGG